MKQNARAFTLVELPIGRLPSGLSLRAEDRTTQRGFTLVELLVVVAIIALLLAILLPALDKAKEGAKTVVCLAQLNQISTAFRVHATDNHDVPIPAIKPDSAAPKGSGYIGGGFWWTTSLIEYFGHDEKLLMCPSTRVSPPPRMRAISGGQRDLSWWDGGQYPEGANKPEEGSYGHNMWVSDFDGSLNPWGWKGHYPKSRHYTRMSEIQYTGETPLFADCLWVGAWPDNALEAPPATERTQAQGPGSWNDRLNRFAMTRHNGHSINVILADGHAETIRPSGLWLLRWNKKSVAIDVAIAWE